MNTFRKSAPALLGLLLVCLPAFAQDHRVTNFSKNGLTFDYPAATKIQDLSDQGGQQLVLVPSGGGA